MKSKHLLTSLLSMMSLMSVPLAQAQTRSPSLFSYTGQLSAPVTNVGWELSMLRTLAVGFNIAFWGAPDPGAGCPNNMQDGPVTSNIFWTSVPADTGLNLGTSSEQWAPISGSGCLYSNWQGFSHAHVRNSSNDGGIGIYTHTGPKPTDASLAFFLPYPSTGDRNRANPYTHGLFPTFRNSPDSAASTLTRPFSGNSTDWNLLRTAIRSHQGLVKFTMESPTAQQIRQETWVTFLNLDCFRNNMATPTKCHIQYEFMNANAGVNSSESKIMLDPSQGGIPVVYGPIGSAGQSTLIEGYSAWTSWAAPTQSSTWTGQKWFQVEISFNQFLNMLKLTAEKLGYKNPTDAQLKQLWGQYYNDRNQWILLEVGVGHEVSNPSYTTRRAYVGGNVTELSVIALPY